jgi:hypothetical protein
MILSSLILEKNSLLFYTLSGGQESDKEQAIA